MRKAGIVAGFAVLAGPLFATDESLRPQPRPVSAVVEQALPEPILISRSAEVYRPRMRPETVSRTSAGIQSLPDLSSDGSTRGLRRWIADFMPRARAQGIRNSVMTEAFAGVRYDEEVIRLDRNQSEFSKPIWEYLDSAVSATRVSNGRQALARHQRTLERIEARFGVEKEVVVAIWGLETSYGSFKGSNDIIGSLATLAYDGRRGAFFEDQLIAALRILQAGDVRARDMQGSWAGAMGHTQFMPTSYLDYAVDFTGDGKRDIWSDDPTDALASTAAYLKRFGWTKGQPWGVEVRLPSQFDFTLADRKIRKNPGDWARMGVRDMAGRAVPNHGAASILLPAGAQGAAFMIFDNFAVIERYNTADAYVIGVGHLSDRIGGAMSLQGDWPRGDRALSFKERKELQLRLTRAGFDTKGIDGRIGPKTIDAVRAYQRRAGLLPDGYASLNLLKRLR